MISSRQGRDISALGLTLLLSVAGACRAEPTATQVAQELFTPSEVDATGSSDVTNQLNAFFDRVPDGATIEFPRNAKYRVEGTLLLIDRRDLTIEGNGATVLAKTDGSAVIPPEKQKLAHEWPRGRRHWMFVGGSGIVIRNLTVIGSNPNAGTGPEGYVKDLEAQHGFDFQGVRGVELDGVTVTDVYGDFVYLGGQRDVWTSDVHIHDSHFERNGRQGIAITGAEDVLIEDNYIGEVRRSSLDLEPHGEQGGARRVVVHNNEFGPGRLLFLASAGKGSQIEDVTIEGNRLERPMNIVVVPPEGERRARFRILNNVSTVVFGSPQALMRFARVDGVEVRGNVQKLADGRQMSGVFAKESCQVIVAENQFTGAARDAEVLPHSCGGPAGPPTGDP